MEEYFAFNYFMATAENKLSQELLKNNAFKSEGMLLPKKMLRGLVQTRS